MTGRLNHLVDFLRNRLKEPLPGKSAHFKMLPSIRLEEFFPIPHDARKSGVLILLYEKEEKIYTLLMLRTAYNGVHSSQVSFPGGSFDSGDSSLEDTALREMQEETGILKESIQIIGSLTELYIPPSNFVVKPVIGFTTEAIKVYPDPREVDEIFETEISLFLNDSNIKTKEITIKDGRKFITPYYDVHGFTVWGATAMILKEFSEVCLSSGYQDMDSST
jgi:8-oxo-dGTP pyrophosphatase MutT (NUDIX family)